MNEIFGNHTLTPSEIAARMEQMQRLNSRFSQNNENLTTAANIAKSLGPAGSLGLLLGQIGAGLYNNYLQRGEDNAITDYLKNNSQYSFNNQYPLSADYSPQFAAKHILSPNKAFNFNNSNYNKFNRDFSFNNGYNNF